MKIKRTTNKTRKGKWIDCSNGWMCSVCKRDSRYDTDFCPHCNADMRRY